jgi:hypothetical protein
VPAGRGDGLAERVVGLAAAALPHRHGPWGTALRAELASIEGRGERLRFAAGCTVLSARLALTRWSLLVAVGLGCCTAAVTWAVTRHQLATQSLEGSPPVALAVLLGAPVVAFALGHEAAVRAGAFAPGVLTGAIVLLAVGIGLFAVLIPANSAWVAQTGTSPFDGARLAGAYTFPYPVLLVVAGWWAPWPVLGAARGAPAAR